MNYDETSKNLKHLSKLFQKALPEKKKAKNLFYLFLVISLTALIGIVLFSFLLNDGPSRDFLLSISSGLFGSGLFATAVEGMNIRNKKSFIDMKLSELKYHISTYIDFISEEMYQENESHSYYEWVDILLTKYNNKLVLSGLSSRLEIIIKCASFFCGEHFDEFNNPFPKKGDLLEIKRLLIFCKNVTRIISSDEDNVKALEDCLKKRIPSVIVNLFPELKDDFNKNTSYA